MLSEYVGLVPGLVKGIGNSPVIMLSAMSYHIADELENKKCKSFCDTNAMSRENHISSCTIVT